MTASGYLVCMCVYVKVYVFERSGICIVLYVSQMKFEILCLMLIWQAVEYLSLTTLLLWIKPIGGFSLLKVWNLSMTHKAQSPFLSSLCSRLDQVTDYSYNTLFHVPHDLLVPTLRDSR